MTNTVFYKKYQQQTIFTIGIFNSLSCNRVRQVLAVTSMLKHASLLTGRFFEDLINYPLIIIIIRYAVLSPFFS